MKRFTTRRFRSPRRTRAGFVLLLVLVLISTCGLYAMGTARSSLAAVLEAASRQEDLQHRWMNRSLVTSVLRSAPRILMPPGRSSELRTSLTCSISLGGRNLLLELADEDAKLPVNSIRRFLDEETASQLVKDVCDGARLRPGSRKHLALGSWEEAIDGSRGRLSPGRLRSIGRAATLWGTGRLNVNKAQPELISALATEALGSRIADQLLEAVGNRSSATMTDLAKRFALNLDQRAKLEGLFGTSSSTYSLWILPRESEAVQLLIAENAGQERATILAFSW